MDRAKSVKRNDEFVYANNPEVDYKFCKKNLVYCPKCEEWVHFRKKTKQPHFAHYPNQTCLPITKYHPGGGTEPRHQKLTEIQQEFQALFIDSKNLEFLEEPSKYSSSQLI